MNPQSLVSQSDFANHGLNKNVTPRQVDDLKTQFANNPANGRQLGYFLGVEFLRQVVLDLESGQYDGLEVSFGESLPEAGETAGKRQLVAQQVKFRNAHSSQVRRRGQRYASVPSRATHPSLLGHPPL